MRGIFCQPGSGLDVERAVPPGWRSGAIVAWALWHRGWGACQLASRLKNNLLPPAEIGFVSLWCFMQAIKLLREP
jgi:hypothetical protein